jgi:hypothetical protein
MARFLQKPGTSGTWTEETTSLTITLGEVAEIILEGGGPPGKEKLDIMCLGEPSPACDERPPAGNRRFFRFAPKAASRLWIVARIPGTTVDHAAPLTLVTLPRKSSSLGPEDVVLFSQEPGDDSQLGAVYRRAVNSSPEKEVAVVNSFAEFVQFLGRFRDTGRRIGKLEFFTHGSPGVIALGSDHITRWYFRGMEGKGYHTVFPPDARVFFAGCNVAADYKGLAFLMDFGRVFLYGGGGSVAGCTTFGHAFGDIGGGKIYHPKGGVRRLYFNAHGKLAKWEGVDDFELSCIDVER